MEVRNYIGNKHSMKVRKAFNLATDHMRITNQATYLALLLRQYRNIVIILCSIHTFMKLPKFMIPILKGHGHKNPLTR